jgi:hypothetical protein
VPEEMICDHAGRAKCEPDGCAGARPHDCNAEHHEEAGCYDWDGRVVYRKARCVPVDSRAGRAAVKRIKGGNP